MDERLASTEAYLADLARLPKCEQRKHFATALAWAVRFLVAIGTVEQERGRGAEKRLQDG